MSYRRQSDFQRQNRTRLLPSDLKFDFDRIDTFDFSQSLLCDLLFEERLDGALDRDAPLVGLDVHLSVIQMGAVNNCVEQLGCQWL